jgi:hypothetical protein
MKGRKRVFIRVGGRGAGGKSLRARIGPGRSRARAPAGQGAGAVSVDWLEGRGRMGEAWMRRELTGGKERGCGGH